ncbi:MAG TPA: DNA repair protein RadA [Candidatus Aminicenantes bacterium]|nr:DNA repair protein RadA [Candidatus Aminicenantes bacterium]
MRDKTVFICQSCGARYPKWMGRCSSCGEWNSLVEEIEEEASPGGLAFAPAEPVLYKDIKDIPRRRFAVGIEDVNKVLGGGLVAGSLVLVGGEPGIGKSTLLLQVARDMAAADAPVLYVSGEESLEQIKLRGDRLGVRNGRLFLLAETNLERILAQAERVAPKVLVIDSIQTVFSAKMTSGPGTISQVREAANQVFRFAKSRQIPAFLVGHITKEGSLAGPKSLEHIVDVVLLFEGERDHSHRVLRAMKNRFGPVSELAVFEMTASGLQPILNPSAFFLRERPRGEPGSAVVCTVKGTRPLLAEIQALVSSTLFSGNPRRMTIGLDHYRTAMLLALVEKKAGYSFAGEDIYINVAGGMSIDEPAVDLGVVMAVVSSLKNMPLPQDMAFFGEVGLSGEIRSVGQPLVRIKEAQALGFGTVLAPAGNLAALDRKEIPAIECWGAGTVREALQRVF